MVESDLQELARRPLAPGILRHLGFRVFAVVVEPAAHRSELPERDLIAAGHVLDVAVDRVVEAELALVRQHQDGRDREGLGRAADAHVKIGGHRLAGRRIAHAEGPHVRLASVLPDADDGARDGSPGHRRGDRLVQGLLPATGSALLGGHANQPGHQGH